MATEILRSVLSFAVGVAGWWTDDPCTELFGAFTVVVDVSHAHHDSVTDPGGRHRARAEGVRRRSAWIGPLLGNDDGTLAEGELGTVVPAPQSLYASK